MIGIENIILQSEWRVLLLFINFSDVWALYRKISDLVFWKIHGIQLDRQKPIFAIKLNHFQFQLLHYTLHTFSQRTTQWALCTRYMITWYTPWTLHTTHSEQSTLRTKSNTYNADSNRSTPHPVFIKICTFSCREKLKITNSLFWSFHRIYHFNIRNCISLPFYYLTSNV